MRNKRMMFRVSAFFMGLAMFVCATNLGWTQGQRKTKEYLDRGWDSTTNAKRRGELMAGEGKKSSEDTKVATAAAEYYIYRITIRHDDLEKHLKSVQDKFETDVKSIMSTSADNRYYVNLLGPALVTAMDDVLKTDFNEYPWIVTNAAMMLPTMAKLKQEDIGNYLVKLVADKRTKDAKDDQRYEVIRLFAIKGLREAMPARVFTDFDLGKKNANDLKALKRMEIKYVDTLTNYIERPVRLNGANATDKELAVFHYFRLQAITSLANAGVPAISIATKPTAAVEGPVAPTLLKVLVKGGLNPPASLHEKVEAAIGVCNMKYSLKTMPDYYPDAAIYLVGETVLEFTDAYMQDYGQFGVKGPARKLPRLPWATECKNLEKALKALKDNAKESVGLNGATGGRVKSEKLEAVAVPLLQGLCQIKPSGVIYQPRDNAKYDDLTALVKQYRPKTGAIFNNTNGPFGPQVAIPAK